MHEDQPRLRLACCAENLGIAPADCWSWPCETVAAQKLDLAPVGSCASDQSCCSPRQLSAKSACSDARNHAPPALRSAYTHKAQHGMHGVCDVGQNTLCRVLYNMCTDCTACSFKPLVSLPQHLQCLSLYRFLLCNKRQRKLTESLSYHSKCSTSTKHKGTRKWVITSPSKP